MQRSGGRFPGGIVIHHSLTDDGTTLDNTYAIDKYHTEVNGWDDIGYHFLIERVDDIVQIMTGRPLQYKGAHCPPNDSIGICLIGNYDNYVPDREILCWLNRLVVGLMFTYDMTPQDISYHSDHSHKSCPGSKFPKVDFLHSVQRIYQSCLSQVA